MKGIIDFHTHAFPDQLADRAIKSLQEEGGIHARLSGRVSSLLQSMDRCGIEKSFVCSIATRPSQFEPILRWSASIRSERIIPFPSVHPDDREAAVKIVRAKQEGFKGIKLHPYYQDFYLDEERMMPVYETICAENLIAVLHTGFDFAFERIKRADPARIIRIKKMFPGLKLVTTHLGAWEDWEDVENMLAGMEIYMEVSFSLEFMETAKAKSIIRKHPAGYVLFGTDSPWTDQAEAIKRFKDMQLDEDTEKRIMRDNAYALLQSV